ncbi:MAG: hypothetical protein MI743_02225 [Sneathiellales bacterium]|nr:hypothetical protein [Sneathiellales bacterium]
MDDLKKALENRDNKSTEELEALYSEFSIHSGFLSSLITFSQSRDLQKEATWLLKYYLEKNRKKSASFPYQDYSRCISALDHWEARLHVLQSLDFFPKEFLLKEDLLPLLREGIRSENKFLRAWSYYGFALLASAHHDLLQETRDILEFANKTETAGSINARLKHARSLLD